VDAFKVGLDTSTNAFKVGLDTGMNAFKVGLDTASLLLLIRGNSKRHCAL
jgi:hypothetical protein